MRGILADPRLMQPNGARLDNKKPTAQCTQRNDRTAAEAFAPDENRHAVFMCDARNTKARCSVATARTQHHESRKSVLDKGLAEKAGNTEIVARLDVADKFKSVNGPTTLFAERLHYDARRPSGISQ